MEGRVIVEQLVVLFPALAAWVIVALVGAIAAGGAMAVRKFLTRLDAQDLTLNRISELLASEIGKLRDKDHAIETRVVRIETHVGIDTLPKWTRRVGDAEVNLGD